MPEPSVRGQLAMPPETEISPPGGISAPPPQPPGEPSVAPVYYDDRTGGAIDAVIEGGLGDPE